MGTLSKVLSALVLLTLAGLAGVRFGLVTERHSPFSPLSLEEADQWFVGLKLDALHENPELCRSVLTPRVIDATPVPDRPLRNACGWSNGFAFSEVGSTRIDVRPLTCEMSAATALWIIDVVQPSARETFGVGVTRIHHLGTYSCRNIEGSNRRSQHAKANAIDISGFTLRDGRTISILKDWSGDHAKAAFLQSVYHGAGPYFRVTLGPDYDAAHADHFHFDRSRFWRWS